MKERKFFLESIYFANKQAKVIRDARRNIKESLKEFLYGTSETVGERITPETRNLLGDMGLKMPDTPCIGGCEVHSCQGFKDDLISIYEGCEVDFCREIERYYGEDTPEWYFGDYVYSEILGIDEKSLLLKGFPQELVYRLLEAIEPYEAMEAEIYEAEEAINQLHTLLHEGFPQLDNLQTVLYTLKSAAITKLNVRPVKYHRLAGSETHALAYYEIDGFKFHEPVMIDERIEKELEKNEIEIGNIDAENKLADQSMDLRLAVAALLDFLGMDADLIDPIIKGEEVDVAGILGIDVPRIEYMMNKSNYRGSRRSRYQEECDWKDEYYNEGYGYEDYYDYDEEYAW